MIKISNFLIFFQKAIFKEHFRLTAFERMFELIARQYVRA